MMSWRTKIWLLYKKSRSDEPSIVGLIRAKNTHWSLHNRKTPFTICASHAQSFADARKIKSKNIDNNIKSLVFGFALFFAVKIWSVKRLVFDLLLRRFRHLTFVQSSFHFCCAIHFKSDFHRHFQLYYAFDFLYRATFVCALEQNVLRWVETLKI